MPPPCHVRSGPAARRHRDVCHSPRRKSTDPQNSAPRSPWNSCNCNPPRRTSEIRRASLATRPASPGEYDQCRCPKSRSERHYRRCPARPVDSKPLSNESLHSPSSSPFESGASLAHIGRRAAPPTPPHPPGPRKQKPRSPKHRPNPVPADRAAPFRNARRIVMPAPAGGDPGRPRSSAPPAWQPPSPPAPAPLPPHSAEINHFRAALPRGWRQESEHRRRPSSSL